MSSSHNTNDTQGLVIGMVEENQELLKRVAGGLTRNALIGAHVLRPYAHPTSSRKSNPPYTGPNRRGMDIVTVGQIAKRLDVRPCDIVFMAKRNYIPGAYEKDGEWYFDGRHLRIWYDDFQMGIVSPPQSLGFVA